ncbi:hypothetical protein, partial [Bacteroides acidifaciens]|uniref:hypothetical protein n=1 Tax=Bacteroides acidifaciens TaxID=85831 RepID=UPI0026E1121F
LWLSCSCGCFVVVIACAVCGNCAYATHPAGALRMNMKNQYSSVSSVPFIPSVSSVSSVVKP